MMIKKTSHENVRNTRNLIGTSLRSFYDKKFPLIHAENFIAHEAIKDQKKSFRFVLKVFADIQKKSCSTGCDISSCPLPPTRSALTSFE